MIENDRYCVDVVTQIMAVRAALHRVQHDILRDHVTHCVSRAMTSGNQANRQQKIAELMDIITRVEA